MTSRLGRVLVGATAGVVLAVVGAAAQVPSAPARDPAPVASGAYDLKRAIEVALQRHPRLTAAGARSEAAKTAIASAGAQFRPHLEAHGSLAHTLAGDRDVIFREETAGRSANRNTPFYTGALVFSVPIVREGTLPFLTFPSELAARARYDSARLAERLNRTEVVANVAVAFYTAVAAREEIAVSQQLVNLNRALYENARRRLEQQLIPQSEVLAAEAALFSATSDLEAARANLAGNLNAFLNSLGVDAPEGAGVDLVDREEAVPATLVLDELLRQTTSSHPLVRAQEAKVKEATAALERVRTERYPTLDAVMSVGAVDDFSLTVDAWAMRALLRLNWRVFDFGALDLKLKEHAEQLLAERAALQDVRNRVAQPVIVAYRNLASSRSRITAAEKSVELAEELARAARRRQEANLVPLSDVLKAEAAVATARRTLIQSKNAVRIDHALLQLALGLD
jgi:outer membrane protein TolC